MITKPVRNFRNTFPQYFAALNSKEIWGRDLALFALANYVLAIVGVWVIPFQLENLAWVLLSEFCAYVFLVVLGLIVRFGFNRLFQYRQPGALLNVSLFVLIGVLKNSFGSLMIYVHEPFEWSRLLRDMLNGVVAGLFIGLLFVVIFGVRLYNFQKLNSLNESRSTLEYLIANLDSEVRSHRKRLADLANDVLGPQFLEIAESLGQAKQRKLIQAKLESSIQQGVRPLIGEIESYPFQGSSQAAKLHTRTSTKPTRLKPDFALDSRPTVLWVAALPTLSILLLFIHTPAGTLRGALAVAVLPLLTMLVRRVRGSAASLVNRHYKTTIIVTSLVTAFVISASSSEALLDQDFWATFVLSALGAVGLQAVFIYGGTVDRATSLVVEELERVVANLESANRLLQRDMWVEQKKWSRMLHGKVQALLTSCIIKLSSASKVTHELQIEIERSLADALHLIKSGRTDKFSLTKALTELKSAWAGVCEVNVSMSAEAKTTLSSDHNLAFVCNVAMKEIISKSFSEFATRRADFKFSMSNSQQLCLDVQLLENGAMFENSTLDVSALTMLVSQIEQSAADGEIHVKAFFETNLSLHA